MNPEPTHDTAIEETAARLPSVLVVDDTTDNLRLLSDILDSRGYDVRAATLKPSSGVSALRISSAMPSQNQS